MDFYDISPLISPKIGVFPGDVPFSRNISLDFGKDDHLLLSSIRTTVHVGSHADAPNHYHARGGDIASRSLMHYLGPCQVIRISGARNRRVGLDDLREKSIRAPRILFRTDSFPDPDRWNSDFASLSPELIHYLADRGVILAGIDTPSVDPENSKDLETHAAIYQRDLAILEGVVLSEVEEGCYFLIALPLKIKDADASPVRAILLPHPPVWDGELEA